MQNTLLLKPAGPDCNLNCQYCFYKCKTQLFGDTQHRMQLPTLEKLLLEFLPQAGAEVSIGFQGGEPTLMGLDFFKEAVALINQLKSPHQKLNLSLQTNGLLLDNAFSQFLGQHHFLVGLSLDGDRPCHDRYRTDYAGNGSFEPAMQAALRLREHGVAFNTLTVLTKANVKKATTLYAFFREYGSGYMQFIPCIERQGEEVCDFCPSPDELGNFLCEMFELWYNGGKVESYIRLFDETLIAYTNYQSASCVQAPHCTATPVAEHNGNIYPCDFFVEPQWKLGNVEQEPFETILNNPLCQTFYSKKQAELPTCCTQCRWLCLCNGDCMKHRLFPGQPSYFCAAWRQFYQHSQAAFLSLKKQLLNSSYPEAGYFRTLDNTPRNAPCPCRSGKKFKKCCMEVKKL